MVDIPDIVVCGISVLIYVGTVSVLAARSANGLRGLLRIVFIPVAVFLVMVVAAAGLLQLLFPAFIVHFWQDLEQRPATQLLAFGTFVATTITVVLYILLHRTSCALVRSPLRWTFGASQHDGHLMKE